VTDQPEPGESSESTDPPQPPPGRPPRLRRSDFLKGLAGTFLFGWAAAWLGSQAGLTWLYYLGLGLVALPLVALMIWLSRVR
jgi:hypothetical protein